MSVFRVRFFGPAFDDRGAVAAAVGAEWEGRQGVLGEEHHHAYLVEADLAEDAIAILRGAV